MTRQTAYRFLIILGLAALIQTCNTNEHCSAVDCPTYFGRILPVGEGIFLFATSRSYNGNLSVLGPERLDDSLNYLCKQEGSLITTTNNLCYKYAPLISTFSTPANSLGTNYEDMPLIDVPIRSLFGTFIARDFVNLFSSDLEISLERAGLGRQTFWSFGDRTGLQASNNCLNGNDDGTLFLRGTVGNTLNKARESWFETDIRSCAEFHKILCLCYNPGSNDEN
ncbi:hypothetical protein [Leptospira sarikeiensis]|uniref:DUF1554 domain-containing protein n=1 Tax=Leptospira sarikeiensis TaxID=2484943 RepID=A0A4R9K7K0_9LEPT|nr:hypothetical protein [Leptospira sarikeiensis]TGL61406.1 hypothetical protein EHQ64_10485 [Leptospira sarikeiensis]